MDNKFDVIVIGGGQSGLAMGYYLRRSGLSFIILDNQNEPGGAWLHTWKSLRLFSPLGDIVMIESVKEARARKVFKSIRPFERFTEDSLVWSDGHEEKIDAVIFCTGFKASLDHLSALKIVNTDGKVDTDHTKVKSVDGLWLVGYGNWTGFAFVTLIGVGRSAKKTVDEILSYVNETIDS